MFVIKFCPRAFNFGATLLFVGDLSQKIVSHSVAKNSTVFLVACIIVLKVSGTTNGVTSC